MKKELTFTLNERQIKRINDWVEQEIGVEVYNEAFEEDCSCCSPLTYHITPSGIGDTIIVSGFGKQVDISLDDDNEWVSSYPKISASSQDANASKR